jgi:hypothetical protein
MSLVQDIEICLNCGDLLEYCQRYDICCSEVIIIHRQQG